MYPVNQVILGGDPLLNTSVNNINEQLKFLEQQKQLLELQQKNIQTPQEHQKLLWDEIDAEIQPLTDEQKGMLFQNSEYVEIYNKIQLIVQSELVNLVKHKIENTPEGKELISNQLKLVKKLKGKIIDSTNREMELFRKFREYSKNNPEVTYDEFLKLNV